jgi:hypothetical protein
LKNAPNIFIGNWRITEMEAWDADYFDMEVSAYLTIRKDLTGEFQFGLVQAQLDGKIESAETPSRLAFSWSAFDENDAVNGRGWLSATGGHYYKSPDPATLLPCKPACSTLRTATPV